MLLVRDVSGPALIEAGKTAVYRATSFNMTEPPAVELQQINWRITADGETVFDLERRGETLEVEYPESLIGKSVLVMPYRNSPTPVVSAMTRVVIRSCSSTTPKKR